MTKSFSRLLVIAFGGSVLVPLVAIVSSRLYAGQPLSLIFLAKSALLFGASVVAIVAFRYVMRKMEPALDAHGSEQAAFLDNLPIRWVDLGIAGAAALSLFLELAVIRWQGIVFEFFAFYKNFGLLSCFAGLGLGYALSTRDRIPLLLVIPLMGWQFALLTILRFGLSPRHLESLSAIPFLEQLSMGVSPVSALSQGVGIYFFLAVVFLITAVAFIPIGQAAGRLMERRPKLRAYGLNLLGSLVGVLLMFLASALWTPPIIWYAVGFAGTFVLLARRPKTLMVGMAAVILGITILAWPVMPSWRRIYSPYQLLELGYSEKGYMVIRAAGQYFQRVYDFSTPRGLDDVELKRIRDYYDLPYRLHASPLNVAIVGSGAGNDVAAALRAGVAKIDAIEIDPAILRAGLYNHPERPYGNPAVNAIVNDARSFLRTSDETYDLIVYALLDSHTLLSHASSVRLDSFVYTVEAFREARARLAPGGVVVISFSLLNDALGRKIYDMLTQAFDGPPVVVRAGYDGAVVFLQSKEGSFAFNPAVLDGTGFDDATTYFANTGIEADVSTDDWPFFYMPRRVYPVSYLPMLIMMLLGTVFITGSFIGERPRFSEASFFLLGAGFMLVETKAITELGLAFGNTWQVIGIVIAAILTMAFLANTLVQWLNIRRPLVPFILLLVSLLIGWFVARGGGLPSTTWGAWGTAALLTSPVFFSGIVFSTLLATRSTVSAVMAVNLLGAMFGGLLEYNSMYFGFQALYLLAVLIYGLALVASMTGLGAAKAPQSVGVPG